MGSAMLTCQTIIQGPSEQMHVFKIINTSSEEVFSFSCQHGVDCLVPQWRFFVKNSRDVSFRALGIFRGPLAPLTCKYVIFFVGSLKIKSLSIQTTNP